MKKEDTAAWKESEDQLRSKYKVIDDAPKFFNARTKDGIVNTPVIRAYKYMGVWLVFHKSIDSTETNQFSVSHFKTGVCFWPGFHYKNFKEAKAGTEVYLATAIDEIFEIGLHEFLTRFMRRNAAIAAAVASDYRFLA